jgi:transcriptional regulator with XRE-family HTH domain
MDFATRMRLIRMVHGLTQQELAVKCGIPTNRLSDIEAGKMEPRGEWERQIKDALHWDATADAALDTLHALAV